MGVTIENADDLWSEIVLIVARLDCMSVLDPQWDDMIKQYNDLCYKYSSACGEIIFLNINE